MVRKKISLKEHIVENDPFAFTHHFPLKGNHWYPIPMYFPRDIACLQKHKCISYMTIYICVSPVLWLYTIPTALQLSPLTLFDNCSIWYILIHINLFWKFQSIAMYGYTYSTMKFIFHIDSKDLTLFWKSIKKKSLFNLLKKHVASLKWKSESTLHFSTFQISASTHSITLGLRARDYSCVCLQKKKKKVTLIFASIRPSCKVQKQH